jgi:hypothetical protein
MYAALLGLMGDGLKKIMEGVSEYDLINYIVLPLGLSKSSKSVYIRTPVDESTRLLGGVIWQILRSPELGIAGQAQALFDYTVGELPAFTPALSVLGDVVQYASGQNPYDAFYGRHAVGSTEFTAYDRRAHTQFLKYMLDKMGVRAVYKFKHDDLDRVAEELESVLGFPISTGVADWTLKLPDMPVVNNTLGRFLKVSDYGVREKIKREVAGIKRENARIILDARDGVSKILNGDELSNDELLALAMKPDVMSRQMMLSLSRKYGMVYFEEWLRAGTTAEKFAIISLMMEKNALSFQDMVRSLPEEERAGMEKSLKEEYPSLSVKELMEKGD